MIDKIIKHCLFIVLVLAAEQGLTQTGLSSPDGKIHITLKTGTTTRDLVNYDLSYNGEDVLQHAVIGFSLDQPTADYYLSGSAKTKKSSCWKTVYGERKIIPEQYNQVLLQFKSKENPSLQITVTCRAYNEGFAFQYAATNKNTRLILNEELSAFPLPADAVAWASTTAQGLLQEKKIKDLTGNLERPLTIRRNDKVYMALGEAALVDYARMKFVRNEKNVLVTRLDGKVSMQDQLASPWRYVLLGDSPADLLQKNYLILNLNQPNQIADTRWIKPGKVIRESTLTTTGAFQCIDFAVKHHIKYICFDAGWYGKEDSDTSDATRVSIDPVRYRGPLDLKRVIAYGNKKNVGVILYVNRHALERQLDTLLPLYQSWGVKGMKFGFVQVGSQQWTQWLHQAVRKAAQHKLLVDIHDEYRSTGYSRTYPNLLTQEGVRGDEENPPTEHSITTLFTRSIAGAADNTNCYFTGHVEKMGTHTAQMAKALCIYSPLEFLYWYDRPVPDTVTVFKEGEIRNLPELAWYDSLPVVWDETRVLEGDMKAYATIARRKANSWYLGSLNGTTARTIKLSCSFLDKKKKYRATIYTDDAKTDSPTRVKISSKLVDSHSMLSFPIGTRSGLAIQFTPIH